MPFRNWSSARRVAERKMRVIPCNVAWLWNAQDLRPQFNAAECDQADGADRAATLTATDPGWPVWTRTRKIPHLFTISQPPTRRRSQTSQKKKEINRTPTNRVTASFEIKPKTTIRKRWTIRLTMDQICPVKRRNGNVCTMTPVKSRSKKASCFSAVWELRGMNLSDKQIQEWKWSKLHWKRNSQYVPMCVVRTALADRRSFMALAMVSAKWRVISSSPLSLAWRKAWNVDSETRSWRTSSVKLQMRGSSPKSRVKRNNLKNSVAIKKQIRDKRMTEKTYTSAPKMSRIEGCEIAPSSPRRGVFAI